MQTGIVLSTALAAAIVVAPATRAQADIIDFVAGAIVGTVIDQARRSNAAPQRVHRSTKTVKEPSSAAGGTAAVSQKSYRPGIPATDEGRQIQTALNYFGFDAGPVDGQIGEKSREAISAYQGYLGYEQTGELSDFEKTLLTSSHERADAGGPEGDNRIATDEEEPRELIENVRAEMADEAMTAPASGGTMTTSPTSELPGVLMASLVAPSTASASPRMAAASASPPAGDAAMGGELVSLFGNALRPTASLASQCSDVSLLTGTNGFTTIASLGDPRSALAEQLCLARSYAIRTGEDLAGGLAAPSDEIASHCRVWGREMRPIVAELARADRDAVLAEVRDFADGTLIPAPELAATATVCLSVGYRTDDMDAALGSALILTGLGEPAHAELMGHHLSLGFGTPRRPALAGSWYDMGLAAADAGGAVFAPGQPERTALIRKASAAMSERSVGELPVPQEAALPAFRVGE